MHNCSLSQINRAWVVPFCSLPGEALTPLLQAPAGQEHQLSLHAKWPKSPVPSPGFPGRWPVVKLKINISLASSTPCPTLDNSCRGLTSPWRCNPSIEMTTFGPRHLGRCRMDKKQSWAQIFLIPAYHLCDHSSVLLCQDPLDRKVTKCKETSTGRDRSLYQCPAPLLGWTLTQDSSALAAEQTEKAFQENPVACLPCQQLPPAQAEPLEPWDVPALAHHSDCQLLQPTPAAAGPAQGGSLAPGSCSLCTHRVSAPKLSKGSFASHVESSTQH